MHYVLTRIDKDLLASEITKAVDILRTIKWVAAAWNEITVDTIKNCFAKYSITTKLLKITALSWMKNLPTRLKSYRVK